MISKEEFEYLWKDSSVYDILNQFYYEHIDLKNLLKVLDELEKWLEDNIEYGDDDYYDMKSMGVETALNKLKELKEEYNVSDYDNN